MQRRGLGLGGGGDEERKEKNERGRRRTRKGKVGERIEKEQHFTAKLFSKTG